eukprot:CAMPEP_0119156352 /NCGR_PEP_ID=MMETSP1310-20130426/52210_1 /TAXON_ID=464262 /ORGANISM="Genus nov. species nov., Strain RCC2339" /LENGTH=664 /DNA_ID=CAMNT_0007148963 /DNA_START=2960 /DNA_END=4955 /DNA_ORIENTATION=-
MSMILPSRLSTDSWGFLDPLRQKARGNVVVLVLLLAFFSNGQSRPLPEYSDRLSCIVPSNKPALTPEQVPSYCSAAIPTIGNDTKHFMDAMNRKRYSVDYRCIHDIVETHGRPTIIAELRDKVCYGTVLEVLSDGMERSIAEHFVLPNTANMSRPSVPPESNSVPLPCGDRDALDSEVCPTQIITQISTDRFDRLRDLLQKWDGYIAVGVYSANLRVDFDVHIAPFLQELTCKERQRLKFHLFLGDPSLPYPINLMRTVVFENSFLQEALLSAVYDVDFVPSTKLCSILVSKEKSHHDIDLPEKYLLVAPAFEHVPEYLVDAAKELSVANRLTMGKGESPTADASTVTTPETKNALLAQIAKAQARIFHQSFVGQNFNLSKWSRETGDALVDVDFISSHHEYYCWFRTLDVFRELRDDDLHICDVHFVDRGFNKIACFMVLRLLNYMPVIISDGFIFHTPELPKKLTSADATAVKFENDIHQAHYLHAPPARRVQFTGFYCTILEKSKLLDEMESCRSLCSLTPSQIFRNWLFMGLLYDCYNDVLIDQGHEELQDHSWTSRGFPRAQRGKLVTAAPPSSVPGNSTKSVLERFLSIFTSTDDEQKRFRHTQGNWNRQSQMNRSMAMTADKAIATVKEQGGADNADGNNKIDFPTLKLSLGNIVTT